MTILLKYQLSNEFKGWQECIYQTKKKKKKKEVASLKIQHDVGERKGSLDVAGIK